MDKNQADEILNEILHTYTRIKQQEKDISPLVEETILDVQWHIAQCLKHLRHARAIMKGAAEEIFIYASDPMIHKYKDIMAIKP